VAEIVRGSILAVSKGQTEAANALALTSFQRLRLVVLPQAMRIAIPPVISQYLNFTKNTSLAIAIGYAEITRLTFQTIGNGQPAPQMIAILMGLYLVFSLVISLVVNLLNRRLQLVTR
jgi:general L-amino acid transport system permease protein